MFKDSSNTRRSCDYWMHFPFLYLSFRQSRLQFLPTTFVVRGKVVFSPLFVCPGGREVSPPWTWPTPMNYEMLTHPSPWNMLTCPILSLPPTMNCWPMPPPRPWTVSTPPDHELLTCPYLRPPPPKSMSFWSGPDHELLTPPSPHRASLEWSDHWEGGPRWVCLVMLMRGIFVTGCMGAWSLSRQELP